MSLDVALQSVAFYVLSCSTCAKINHRRKAKVQAKKERAEKQKLEVDQPGLYHHPSPFNTNPYWTEEIMMGPGPPPTRQKNGSKNASQRALNTAGQGSSYAGSTALSSDPPSSPTAGTDSSRLSGDGWNRKRYQREDEDLWGHDVPGPGQRIMDAIAKAGSSARGVIESRLGRSKEEEEPRPYFQARNPPVNDLHPPVVSSAPASRDESRWMLQPPPSAKVMEGKERVNRSRAGSNGSSRRDVGETPLSRQITERLVEAKLQRGEGPLFTEGRSLSSRTEQRSRPSSAWPRSREQERSRSPSFDLAESSNATTRRRRKPAPISVSTSERSSWGSVDHIPIPANAHLESTDSETREMREMAKRPVLTTILSSSNAVHQVPKGDGLEALRGLNHRSSDSSLDSDITARRISPSANAMPASIPSKDPTLTGLRTSEIPSIGPSS